MGREEIGRVVGGGYRSDLLVDLNLSTERVQIGSFVVCKGHIANYFGVITDLQHGSDDDRFLRYPARERLPHHLASIIESETLYSTAEVAISLSKSNEIRQESLPLPSRSIPDVLSPVFMANQTDMEAVIGREDERHFLIGYTREDSLPVPMDLGLLIQRNSGVFGATGTGKSFLARLLVAGLIQKNLASSLIFDLHGEYSQDDIASDSRVRVPGLKQLFPDQVQVFALGKHGTVRGTVPDRTFEIRLCDIRTEDILLLDAELSLTDTAPLVLDQLERHFGRAEWLKKFRQLRYGTEDNGKVDGTHHMTVAEWAKATGVHPRSAEALFSKLGRVIARQYVVEDSARDSIGEIIDALKSGKTVVLSFGRFEQELDFLLVSNVLMRRVRDAWELRADHYRSTLSADEPRPLVVILEEAHRLLNRSMASQTVFGRIAREMRKSFLTLLIVDQRPSGIYDEVLSQLGTRICGWLGDEDDVHAVLAGLAGREGLKKLLSNLRPSQEVLITGWGIPIPLPIRVRPYDATIAEQLKPPQ